MSFASHNCILCSLFLQKSCWHLLFNSTSFTFITLAFKAFLMFNKNLAFQSNTVGKLSLSSISKPWPSCSRFTSIQNFYISGPYPLRPTNFDGIKGERKVIRRLTNSFIHKIKERIQTSLKILSRKDFYTYPCFRNYAKGKIRYYL